MFYENPPEFPLEGRKRTRETLYTRMHGLENLTDTSAAIHSNSGIFESPCPLGERLLWISDFAALSRYSLIAERTQQPFRPKTNKMIII